MLSFSLNKFNGLDFKFSNLEIEASDCKFVEADDSISFSGEMFNVSAFIPIAISDKEDEGCVDADDCFIEREAMLRGILGCGKISTKESLEEERFSFLIIFLSLRFF